MLDRLELVSSTAARRRRRRVRATALFVAVIATCSLVIPSVFATTRGATTGRFPVTVTGTSGSATLRAKPTRIVSLSPTATEMLYAVGAGAQVVAVDSDSDYPTNAPKTSLSGLSPNVEAIAKYNPDLVIVSYLPASGSLARSLSALHIPLLYEDAATNLAGTYDQIEAIGKATGHGSEADRLVSSMKSEIASAVKKAPRFSSAVTYYFELDQTYYSATSSTYVGSIMALFHLKDVADAAPGAASAGGYPQLSSEFIVKANPDLVFLADTVCCHQTFATVSARPGWKAITAVKDDGVVALNDDVASRWGPRVVDLVDDVESALVRLHSKLAA